jgi:sulfur oxygenase/reductase
LAGSEEPVFSVVHNDLPKLISMNQWLKKYANGQTEDYAVDSGETVTVMATHRIRPGKEAEFEAGEIATMEMLKESTGMTGFQVLQRIGLSTPGSGHATVESIMEDLKDSSGSKLKRTAEVWEGYTLPSEYLVMVEWDSLHYAISLG